MSAVEGHQRRSTDLYSVAVNDDTLAPLIEHNADRPAGGYFRVPALILSRCKWGALERLASSRLHRGEIPGWVRRIFAR
jgi:hypothetical protein